MTSIGLEIRDLEKLDQSSATNQVLGWSDVALADGRTVKACDAGLYFKSRDDVWRMAVGKDSQLVYEPHEKLFAEAVI